MDRDYLARCPPLMRHAAGFTLIELMIVLVVVGIGTTMVTLRLAPNPSRELRMEARQLAQAFSVAQRQVQLDGRQIVWTAGQDGYRFERAALPVAEGNRKRSSPAIDAFSDDDQLRPRQWRRSGTRVMPPARLVFGGDWIGPAWQVRLVDGNAVAEIHRGRDGRLSVH